MYMPHQVIFDQDAGVPVKIGEDVWDLDATPRRNTHFISDTLPTEHGIFLPESVEEAQRLLDEGLIRPSPCPTTHCDECGNWKSNCAEFRTCINSSKHQHSLSGSSR